MSVREFCARFEPAAPDAAGRALLLGEALLAGPLYGFGGVDPDPAVPFGWRFGVCGVGVALSEEGLVPTLFSAALDPGEIAFLDEAADLQGAIAESLGANPVWLAGVRLAGARPFEPQIAAGDSVSSAQPGSVGCGVRWPGGVGFLTAGHVGGAVTSPAFSGSRQIGMNVYSNDPSHHGREVEEDVALFALDPGVTIRNPFLQSAVGSPGAPVSVVAQKSVRRTRLHAYCRWQYSPRANGTWGDVYAASAVVSFPGDSGAPVADAAGKLIGHVVGELPGVGTIVQDIHYQLSKIRREPRFRGIRI